MDNKVKSFNKKLAIILFIILAILGTLLVKSTYAIEVPPEIESLDQKPDPDFPWMTYEDLVQLYDVLCCEHGRPLKGQNSVHMEGTYRGNPFSYVWNSAVAGDVTLAHLTDKEKGTKIEEHTIYWNDNPGKSYNFDKSTYTHYTFG